MLPIRRVFPKHLKKSLGFYPTVQAASEAFLHLLEDFYRLGGKISVLS